MEKTYYVYYMLERPVDLGAQPDKLVTFTDEQGTAPSGHHHWGTVYYDRPLSEQELKDYEMEPGGTTNRAPW